MNEQIAKVIGKLLRLTAVGVAFGFWQHSFTAGMFAFVFTLSLEEEN